MAGRFRDVLRKLLAWYDSTTAVGVVDLTLQTRGRGLTLRSRGRGLTLQTRSLALTMRSRG